GSTCPLSVRISSPLLTSHSLTVLSRLPLASVCPSGEKATEVTPSLCPLSVWISAPLTAFHSLTVLSPFPEASVLPSGEKATDQITLEARPLSVACSL